MLSSTSRLKQIVANYIFLDLKMTFSKSYFSFFAGEPNDSVVLCSESAVFELKEAETSNSLLLVKDMLQGNLCKELKNDLGGSPSEKGDGSTAENLDQGC